MEMTCNEIFLSDISRVRIYKKNMQRINLPFNVPNINTLKIDSDIDTKHPILDISYEEDGVIANEESIKVKQTAKQNGTQYIYIYEVTANLIKKSASIDDLVRDQKLDDVNVVISTMYGDDMLLYTIPGTSSIEISYDLKNTDFKISLVSLNDFIPLL